MRCGCPECGTWMVHSEGPGLGCVCPACGRRCRDCLGTDTLMSRDALKRLKDDPVLQAQFLRPAEEDALQDAPESPDLD